jgi:hypothetical protein
MTTLVNIALIVKRQDYSFVSPSATTAAGAASSTASLAVGVGSAAASVAVAVGSSGVGSVCSV